MALLYNLELKEVRKDDFFWRIDKFFKKKLHISSFFKFGRSNSHLTISSAAFLSSKCTFYSINLKLDVPDGLSLFSKVTLYSICLFDSKGNTISSRRGAAYDDDLQIHVMYEKEEVIRSALQSKGTLAIRLSWYPQDLVSGTNSVVKESVSSSLLENLSNDFSYLYDSKIDTDCVLMVDGVQFPAHRVILSSRSSVFNAMFHHETSSKLCGVLNIMDVKSAIVGDVLKYVYSGKIHGLNSETAVPMYEFADKYAIFELRDKCLCFLKSNLTLENICDVIILNETLRKTELEDKILQFIEDRIVDLEKSDSWMCLTTVNPLLVNKYIISSFVASKKNKTSKMI